MLTLPPSVRIFVCLEATDLRKGFDGLAAATREVLNEDPLSGHLFVFFNRRRNRVKALLWDRSGLCIWYKRIEKSRFQLAALDAHRCGRRAEIEAAELMLILEGITLQGARRRPRFTPRRSA
jgi:transposase